MKFGSLSERFQGSSYTRLQDQEPGEKSGDDHNGCIAIPWYCNLILTTILVGLATIVGYMVCLWNHFGDAGIHVEDTSNRVSIGATISTFQYNSSFAAPPPKDSLAEQVWDSMIPNGLGYVRHGNETSVISVFHQLHCLYIVRRAYYSNSTTDDGLEVFDLGKERKPHVAHCFDYLRQGILCSADSTMEPGVDSVNGFLGAGFPRQCRNFQQLRDWAESHRAFDAHGFLVETDHASGRT